MRDLDAEALSPPPADMVGNIEKSAKCGKLFAAIARAQAKMKHPAKDKIAKIKMKSGGEYSYKYSDLPEVLDSTRALAEEGVAVIQNPSLSNGRVFLTTLLGCDDGEDGQWISGMLGMSVADDHPQTVGGAISYARRYSIQSMAGIAAEDDNDANAPDESPQKGRETPQDGKTITPNPAKAEEVISEGQQKRIFAIGKPRGWGGADIKSALAEGWGITSTAAIKRKNYEDICKMIENEYPLAALKRLKEKVQTPPSHFDEFDPGPSIPPDQIPF